MEGGRRMDIWGLYVGSLVSLIALCVLIPLCKGISAVVKAARERREAEAHATEQAESRRKEAARRAEQQAQEEAKKAAAAAEKKRKKEEKKAAAAAREAERQRRQAEKLENARQLAEYAEKALQAEKELQALRARNIPAAQEPKKPAATTEEKSRQEPPALSLAQFAAAHADAPQPFKGQTVSFTGTLYDPQGKHVPRAQAMQLVKSMGGKAYETMPAGTTLLVVGDKPGMNKLDKADEWIGQVRKITPAQFFAMAQA